MNPEELKEDLIICAKMGYVVPRTENNPYLDVSYRGTDGLISSKWNVKIYTSGKIVTNDWGILEQISKRELKAHDPSKKVLQADDSGWGSPLCGVALGITDGTEIKYAYLRVKYFQSPLYETKAYLKEYADAGYRIITEEFKATPQTHRIEICTGYVNSELKELLRSKGFDVCVTEIKGLLQSALETRFREYVGKVCGADLAYDPKEFTSSKDIAIRYNRAVKWARENAPHLLKSGWKSLKG